MISPGILVFVSFVILSALLLWAVIYSRGPVLLKLALIVTVPLFAFVVTKAVRDFAGYPLHSAPPKTAQVLWTKVQEPDWIYVWAIPEGKSEPRAYRVKYTRSLHGQADALQAIMKATKGNAQIGLKRIARGEYRFYQLPPLVGSKETP